MHHRRPELGFLLALTLSPACASRYPHGRGLVGQLEAEVVALHRKARTLEDKLIACDGGDDVTELYQQLVQVFPVGGDVGVAVVLEQAELQLPWSHLFADDGAVSLRGRMSLDLLTTVLDTRPDRGILIIGHGYEAGFQGAKAVAEELTDRFKVDPRRILVAADIATDEAVVRIAFVPFAPADEDADN